MLCNVNGCSKDWKHSGPCNINQAIGKRRAKASGGFCIVEEGKVINVKWADDKWFLAKVGKYSTRGTYCYYFDGEKRYERLEEMEYIIMHDMEFNPEKKIVRSLPDDTILKLCTCAICLDTFKSPVMLRCSHTFCYDCLQNSIMMSTAEQKGCPSCRAPVVSMRDAIPQPLIQAIIDSFHTKEEVTTNVNEAKAASALLTFHSGKKARKTFKCSLCKGMKVAAAQHCLNPCPTECVVCEE